MKKRMKLVLAMIPALALGGCKSVLEIPVVETGWDIYTGGQYRYCLLYTSRCV